MTNFIVPRATRRCRTMRCRSVGLPSMTGMKSSTSPTPSGVMKRVMSMAVFGMYNCFDT